MIDEKEKWILSYVVSQCSTNYKVIENSDFEDFFKQRFPKKKCNIKNILTHLDTLGLVDIKFSDDQKYCLCATKSAEIMFEEEKNTKKTTKKIKIEVVLFIFLVAFFAFLGGFLGTLLVR